MSTTTAHVQVRVLTYNTYRMGSMVNDGMRKLAFHIKQKSPDILIIQEVMKPQQFEDLLDALGREQWDGVIPSDYSYIPSNGILCRRAMFTIDRNDLIQIDAGQGPIIAVQVRAVPPLQFSMYLVGVHLDWRNYGPELIFFADRSCGLYDIIESESCPKKDPDNCRVAQIRRLLEHTRMQQALRNADQAPVVLCGDFNCPSHQDWLPQCKHRHNDFELEWPSTKLLTDAGMIDSYRVMHPDPEKEAGDTWSPIYKKHEKTGADYPQDRIDFVFYKSARLRVLSSEVYAGEPHHPIKHMPDHKDNEWPSDHAAVLTVFQVLPANEELIVKATAHYQESALGPDNQQPQTSQALAHKQQKKSRFKTIKASCSIL